MMNNNMSRIKLSYEDPNTEQIIEQSILYDHEPLIEIDEEAKWKNRHGDAIVNKLENGFVQKGIFKCFECIFSCLTTLELAVHYQTHRANQPFKCFQCGYQGKNKDDFIEHSISHIENYFYKCSKCNYKASTVKAMKTHIFSKHDKINGMSPLRLEDGKQQEAQCRKKERNSAKSKDEDVSEDEKEITKRGLTKVLISSTSIKYDEEDIKMFTCPTCYFIFPSKQHLSQHDYSTHIKNWRVKKPSKLHLQNMAKKRKINNDLKSKMNPYVKLESLFTCSYCYIIFISEYDFDDHNSSHNIVTDCYICGNKYLSNYELKEHINGEHPGCPVFSCINCGNFFATESELQFHMKSVHNSKGILSCPYCPRLIKTEQGLKLHIEAHSKVKTLKCLHCSYIGINPSDLKKHSTKHLEPKYICPNNCGAAYKTLESLTNHIRNCSEDEDDDEDENQDADDEEDFKIESDINNDSYEDSPQIEIDISQKEKLVCSECKKCFEEPSQLKEHLLLHFNKNPFRCQKCGNRYSTGQILEDHMISHSEESTVICSICNKNFDSAFKLNRHMFSHSLGRHFECPHCSQTFETKDSLEKHMQKHESVQDEKPFVCHICDFISKEVDALKNHISKEHNSQDVKD